MRRSGQRRQLRRIAHLPKLRRLKWGTTYNAVPCFQAVCEELIARRHLLALRRGVVGGGGGGLEVARLFVACGAGAGSVAAFFAVWRGASLDVQEAA